MVKIALCSPREEELRLLRQVFRAAVAQQSEEDAACESCHTPAELEEQLSQTDRVDVVCLDVTVQGAVGTAERLRLRHGQALLVLTADATISPLQYIRPTILAAALLLRPLEEKAAAETAEQVLLALRQRQDEGAAFVFNVSGETLRLPYGEILYFESREKRVFVRTRNREYGFYDTLEHLEQSLPEEFQRCHKSYIVHLTCLRGVNLSKNTLSLVDDIQLPVSRTYKPAMKAWKAGSK